MRTSPPRGPRKAARWEAAVVFSAGLATLASACGAPAASQELVAFGNEPFWSATVWPD